MSGRPRRRGEVLSVVERGWRGARECSLILSRMGIPVTHVIKGYLNAELRAMIQPYPGVRLVSVPRVVFRTWLWWLLVWRTLTGRLQWLLVDHDRTRREISWWCRAFGLTLVSIRETDHRYELWVGSQRVPVAAVFQV